MQVAYDKCWHAVQATEADEIEELGALVRQLERDAWSRPRQFVRVPDSRHSAVALLQGGVEESASPCDGGGGHSSSCCSRIVLDAKFGLDRGRGKAEEEAAAAASSMGGPGHVALVTCLNQLMAQAAGVNQLVRPKLLAWGVASGAYYRLAGTQSHIVAYEPWADLPCFPKGCACVGCWDDGGRVRWALPKTRQRAVEKLYRVYNLDVSMLVLPLLTQILKSCVVCTPLCSLSTGGELLRLLFEACSSCRTCSETSSRAAGSILNVAHFLQSSSCATRMA